MGRSNLVGAAFFVCLERLNWPVEHAELGAATVRPNRFRDEAPRGPAPVREFDERVNRGGHGRAGGTIATAIRPPCSSSFRRARPLSSRNVPER